MKNNKLLNSVKDKIVNLKESKGISFVALITFLFIAAIVVVVSIVKFAVQKNDRANNNRYLVIHEKAVGLEVDEKEQFLKDSMENEKNKYVKGLIGMELLTFYSETSNNDGGIDILDKLIALKLNKYFTAKLMFVKAGILMKQEDLTAAEEFIATIANKEVRIEAERILMILTWKRGDADKALAMGEKLLGYKIKNSLMHGEIQENVELIKADIA